MGKKKIIAAITIGQSPRTDITHDILPLLPPDTALKEYGALDDYTLKEVESRFSPDAREEILVSRMRDGQQARFTEPFITPLVQSKINLAEEEGANAIILLCTGVFPRFRHQILLMEPEPIFHSIVGKLADGKKIGILVPTSSQVEQAYQTWRKSGVDVAVTSASPYMEFEKIREAGRFFIGKNLQFLCLDCMGFSLKMKQALEEMTGLPVLLPRTLSIRILNELFS